MNPETTTPEVPKEAVAQGPRKAKTKPMLPIPRERLLHQIQRSPFVDWLIILAIAAVIALILVGVGVSVYLGTGTRLSAPSLNAPHDSALPLNEAALQGVLSSFDGKTAERSAFTRSYSAPQDPSLP